MPLAPERLSTLRIERAPAPHRKVYKTAAWLRFRAYRLSLNPLCQQCERNGLHHIPAVDVHHVIALRNGGQPYDLANTEALCHECHSRVTRSGQ